MSGDAGGGTPPGQACSNCAFGIAVTASADVSIVPTTTWTCHAAPPTPSANGTGQWPTVAGTDWCGAWRQIAGVRKLEYPNG